MQIYNLPSWDVANSSWSVTNHPGARILTYTSSLEDGSMLVLVGLLSLKDFETSGSAALVDFSMHHVIAGTPVKMWNKYVKVQEVISPNMLVSADPRMEWEGLPPGIQATGLFALPGFEGFTNG